LPRANPELSAKETPGDGPYPCRFLYWRSGFAESRLSAKRKPLTRVNLCREPLCRQRYLCQWLFFQILFHRQPFFAEGRLSSNNIFVESPRLDPRQRF
jgi:hypothetical protein